MTETVQAPPLPEGYDYRAYKTPSGGVIEAHRDGRTLFEIVLTAGRVERIRADQIKHNEDAAREWLTAWESRVIEACADADQPGDGSIALPPGPVILHGWMGSYAFDGNRFRQIA